MRSVKLNENDEATFRKLFSKDLADVWKDPVLKSFMIKGNRKTKNIVDVTCVSCL